MSKLPIYASLSAMLLCSACNYQVPKYGTWEDTELGYNPTWYWRRQAQAGPNDPNCGQGLLGGTANKELCTRDSGDRGQPSNQGQPSTPPSVSDPPRSEPNEPPSRPDRPDRPTNDCRPGD